ncbi:NUDIX hydrolase [Alkaliphilus serpentinus]|uniref:CoA pyrophosphatase n=1 Tax=Alkaliphilus serpentinus TaxID=1482731 RepID=A0A833MBG4_9FIRM|nr:CoA pyrophosphatase [Alkaliphilus serpentinus]KAB3533217.1 CoA pyrophosphatase [Alkaliphilus serpentinus]
MNIIQDIKKAITNRPSKILDVKNHYSVLIPIIENNGELCILFQVRAHHLQHQPGEICFPGGRIENNEKPQDTAIRESMEELNVSNENIDLIGVLDTLVTPFNSIIYSFCGLIKDIKVKDIHFNPHEVNSLFTVPVKELLIQKPLIHDVKMILRPNEDFPYYLVEQGYQYEWKSGNYPVFFFKYQNYVIWGITAKLLNSFLNVVEDYDIKI